MNDKMYQFKKEMAKKWIVENGNMWKRENLENATNPIEVSKKNSIKSISLYEPKSYKEIWQENKKKYRDIKIQNLENHLDNAIWNIKKAIDLYKELKDKTEYWENKSTLDFNFKNWNKIKKVNGKIAQYLKELIEVKRSLKNEKN